MKCESSIRTELLDLVPRVGHCFGLSRTLSEHLAGMIRWTRPLDWEDGNRAVVYRSVIATARDCGVTERQIYNRERAIARAFDLTAATCANRRRFGKRDDSGRIVQAYGVELSGLKAWLPRLRLAQAEIAAADDRWKQLKRQLSESRGRLQRLSHAVLSQGQGQRLEVLADRFRAIEGRVHAQTPAHELERRLAAAHSLAILLETALLEGASDGEKPVQTSDKPEENFRRTDKYNDKKPGSKEPVCRHGKRFSPPLCPEAETGADRVSPQRAMQAASPRFRERLGLFPGRSEIVIAAAASLDPLGIHASAWREACETLGPYPAALCVMVADQAHCAQKVATPGGYLRGMTRKALKEGLRLDRTILFGREAAR